MAANYQTMDALTDEMLVRRAQDGDRDAFSELMRRTFSRSLKLAQHILSDREEAEDQVQDSYLNVWLHLGKFERQAQFSTWVYRIVTNQCLMRLRQLRGKSFVCLADRTERERMRQTKLAGGGNTPEEDFAIMQLSEKLRREIAQLPPILRDVLVLRDLNETPMAEVAEHLGITEFAAKSRLTRARNAVRTRWTKTEEVNRRSCVVSIQPPHRQHIQRA